MRIGEVAQLAGVAPSTLRYYERAGLLPPPDRMDGRRAYTPDALFRLAVVLHARHAGLGIEETRRLLAAGPASSPARSWRLSAAAKIAALDTLIEEARAMKDRLCRISSCKCSSWDECGRMLLAKRQDRASHECVGLSVTTAGPSGCRAPRTRRQTVTG